MDDPRRRSPRLRRATKIAVLAGTLAPGAFAQALDANAASTSYTKHVEIGVQYPLDVTVQLTASCSGCGHTLPGVRDAFLDVEFLPEGADKPIPLTIAGNATFIAPVTGTLRYLKVNRKLVPPSVEDEAKEHGCTIVDGDIYDNPFE